MLRSTAFCLALLLGPLAATASGSPSAPAGMTRVAGATYRPLFAQPAGRMVPIKAFAIDTVPVSARSFLAFVKSNPQWSRGKVTTQLADGGYLADVIDSPSHAATQVSWFAAQAYCESRGARLPSIHEWEYVASASETERNAAADASFRQRVLRLALQPKPVRYIIGSGFRNAFGVRDLHGGVTEWTADGVKSAHAGHGANCATGTVDTGDAGDYAAFMRNSFRRNTEARSTSRNVGFRCAVSL